MWLVNKDNHISVCKGDNDNDHNNHDTSNNNHTRPIIRVTYQHILSIQIQSW